MRLPRFTIRRLVMLVAVVGVSLSAGRLAWRRLAYQRIAEGYAGEEKLSRVMAVSFEELAKETDESAWMEWAENHRKWADYQSRLRRTYERAARCPWLPVPPDPPPPE